MSQKTYFIKTFGCQMNFSDSERMESFLEQNGWQPVKKIEQADLVIFNTCGVRQTAEDRVYGLVHNLRQFHAGTALGHDKITNRNKKIYIAPGEQPIIVLTGCLAQRMDVQKKLSDRVDLFIPIADFPQMFNLLARKIDLNAMNGRTLGSAPTIIVENYLCIKPKYKYTATAFVPIMTGCNNFCAYCVVPYARDREWSRPTTDILEEIKNLSTKGCQEITLLGQNVNSYQFKMDNFPSLLNSLAQAHPQIKFKFLTSHPKDFSEKLMQVIAANENISREIHLPIQAGSNRILQAMNRPYTQKHYLDLIQKAQKMIPDVSFTTDIIVGFPGETAADFQESVKVFQQVHYNEAYINKYSPRPGTAAYKFPDDVSLAEKKKREKVLREIVKAKRKS